jgi:hypothetical protein
MNSGASRRADRGHEARDDKQEAEKAMAMRTRPQRLSLTAQTRRHFAIAGLADFFFLPDAPLVLKAGITSLARRSCC